MGLGVENVDALERDKAFHKGCLTPGDAGDKEGCLIQLE